MSSPFSPEQWAPTRATLDAAQLAAEVRPIDVPLPLWPEVTRHPPEQTAAE